MNWIFFKKYTNNSNIGMQALKCKLFFNSSQSIKYLSWYMLLELRNNFKKGKKWIRQKWFTLYSHPKFVHSLSLGDNNRNEFKKKWKHSLSFSLFHNDTERTHLKTGKTNLRKVSLSSVAFNLVGQSWKETLEQTVSGRYTNRMFRVTWGLQNNICAC